MYAEAKNVTYVTLEASLIFWGNSLRAWKNGLPEKQILLMCDEQNVLKVNSAPYSDMLIT